MSPTPIFLPPSPIQSNWCFDKSLAPNHCRLSFFYFTQTTYIQQQIALDEHPPNSFSHAPYSWNSCFIWIKKWFQGTRAKNKPSKHADEGWNSDHRVLSFWWPVHVVDGLLIKGLAACGPLFSFSSGFHQEECCFTARLYVCTCKSFVNVCMSVKLSLSLRINLWTPRAFLKGQ